MRAGAAPNAALAAATSARLSKGLNSRRVQRPAGPLASQDTRTGVEMPIGKLRLSELKTERRRTAALWRGHGAPDRAWAKESPARRAPATYMPEPSWGVGRMRLPALRTNPAHWRRAGIVGQPTVVRAGLRRCVQRGGAGLERARKGMLEGVLKAPVPAPAVRRPSGGGG